MNIHNDQVDSDFLSYGILSYCLLVLHIIFEILACDFMHLFKSISWTWSASALHFEFWDLIWSSKCMDCSVFRLSLLEFLHIWIWRFEYIAKLNRNKNDLLSPCLASPLYNPICYLWLNSMLIVFKLHSGSGQSFSVQLISTSQFHIVPWNIYKNCFDIPL